MNKNTLIGSILIAVIVIWWMAVNNANAEAQAAARAAQAKAKTEKQVSQDSAKSLVIPSKAPEIKAAPVLGGSENAAAPAVANDSAASLRLSRILPASSRNSSRIRRSAHST